MEAVIALYSSQTLTRTSYLKWYVMKMSCHYSVLKTKTNEELHLYTGGQYMYSDAIEVNIYIPVINTGDIYRWSICAQMLVTQVLKKITNQVVVPLGSWSFCARVQETFFNILSICSTSVFVYTQKNMYKNACNIKYNYTVDINTENTRRMTMHRSAIILYLRKGHVQCHV